MTKTRDLANLIADSKVGPSEIDTTGTYQVNSLGVGKAASVKLDVAGDIASSTKLHVTIGANTPVIRLTNTIGSGGDIDMYSYSDGAFYINNSLGTGIGMLANKDVYVGKNLSVGDSVLSTYHTNYPAVDIGSSASVQGYTGNNGAWLQSNLFMSVGGHWTSKSDDYSAMLELYDGNFNFYNTASGTGTRTLLTPMTIRQSGNVGIGEPSPNQPLVVKRATDGVVIVANTAQAGGQGIGFFTDTANNRVGVFNNSSSTLDMVFNTQGIGTAGEAMRIDNATKNVGIGISPAQKLVISGGSSDVTMLWNSTDTAYHNFGILKNGSLVQMGEFNNAGTTLSQSILNIEMNGDKVAIGNLTSPDATLHVNGPAIIGGDANAATSPIAGLHILDNSYSHWSSTLSKQQVALRVETYWNAASGQRAIGTYGGGIGFNHLGGHSTNHDENLHSWIGPRVVSTPSHETSALVFATNNNTSDEDAGITEQMVVMPSGNVGIGVTDPRNDLHVGGAICSLKGVSNGASLVKVVGRGMYHIMASNNYGAGSAVRHAAFYVCLDYEGDEINHTTTVFTNNGMTVSFYISGGWLYCNNLPSGNNQVSVFGM